MVAGVVVGLAVLFAWLSLANVSGATRRADGSCCDTEYEHGGWSLAPTLLVVPIYLVARSARGLSLAAAAAAVAFAGASVFFIAHTGVTRIEEAGWGDGLESRAYVEAVFQSGLFVAAAMIGVSRRSRARPPEPPYPVAPPPDPSLGGPG